jgi:hypothetical protein
LDLGTSRSEVLSGPPQVSISVLGEGK